METSNDSKTYALFSTVANRKIITELEMKGSKVFQFTPVETEKIANDVNNAFIQNDLAQINWIIFPDVFSVDYFVELLEANEFDLFELDEKRIVVFGEAVADRLRFSQIHADLIPNSVEIDDIFSAIVNYVGRDDLSDLSFLLVKDIEYQSEINRRLSKIGAEIIELNIYRKLANDKKEAAKLKTLLKGGAIDEFIFSSPEDVFFLREILTDEKLSEIFSETKVLGTNEITMQTLRENKLNN